MSQPLTINTANSSRQSSFSNSDIKSSVKDFVESLRSEVIEEENILDPTALGTSNSALVEQITPSLEQSPGNQPEKPVQLQNQRPQYLPPLSDLESYVLENTSENFLNVLPDIAEAIASFLRTYPDQNDFVWKQIKPVLREIRRRNKFHGRNLSRPSPPICPKKLHSWVNVHGEEMVDYYSWLTDKDNPDVMKHLLDENRYSEQSLAHTKTLQKVLFNEFVSRLDENAESAHVTLSDGWVYYTKKVPGGEYRLHCRQDKNGLEEVYLDENKLSLHSDLSDQSFFNLGFLRHSPDCTLVAYGIDVSGNERYAVHFLNLETKETLDDVISDCYEDFEFSNCGKYAFYTKIDEYERAYQLKRHKLGTSCDEDVVLYEETDEMFFLTLTKSCNKRYLFLNTAAQVTSETRLLNLEDALNQPIVLFPRRENVQYTIEHHSFPDTPVGSQDYRGYFYVSTNENSRNIQLFRVPTPSEREWAEKHPNGITVDQMLQMKETVVENRDFVLIEGFQVRARHLIVFERSNCMQNIRIINLEKGGKFDSYHYVSFSESSVYSIWPGSVDEEVADLSKSVLFDTNLLRYTYTSFIQPKQVVDYNMDTRINVVVHEERVHSPGYDRALYASRRLWATGTDGTAIPMSIVYRKDLLGAPLGNSGAGLGIATSGVGNPTLLHAYGAYGYSLSPIFSTARLSLLDRGFIYAVAHVRGGSEMGNAWYEEGKLAKKTNTFTDFISCAEYLIKEEYTCRDKLAIYGRSAGGLLIGAVVTMRPDLFRSVLTQVPFVDVINTMFDTSIPWTAFEFEEWGNPADPHIYSVMKNYCPYTNVKPQLYPNMLIVGGMNDPRVAYFEPAKWTARLREIGLWSPPGNSEAGELPNSDERMLLLKIQEAGHSGSSGQYAYLDDTAFEYAFLISTIGAPFKPVSSTGKDTSINGVDYDTYWEELEKDEEEEEEEEEDDYEDDLPAKPSTPLQKFSDYWKRRASKIKEKKSPIKSPAKKKRGSKLHSRTGSAGGMKSLFRTSKSQINEEIDEETSDKNGVEKIPQAHDMNRSSTANRVPVSGSRISLRQQLYPHEDESGRVQRSSKLNNNKSRKLSTRPSGKTKKGAVTMAPKNASLIQSKKVQKKISASINRKIEETMAVKANSLGKLTILKSLAKGK